MFNTNEIIRPYLSGEDKKKRVIDEKTRPIKLMSKKASLGDHYLRRPSFLTPNVKPRYVPDFDKLRSQLEEKEGVKVRLGPGTVQKLTNIQIDDPEDKAWIDEYNRRKANGETDEQLKALPPLGRLQKKKYVNVSENQKLELKDELERLRQQITSGLSNLEKKQSLITLADATTKIIDRDDLNQIKFILDTLKLETNPKSWGMDDEIDYNTYKLNAGTINLFLLNKAIREGRDINKPIIFQNVGGLREGKSLMSIPKLVSGVGFKGKFILKDALIIAQRKTPSELKAEEEIKDYKKEIKNLKRNIIIMENDKKKMQKSINNNELKINKNENDIKELYNDELKLDKEKIELGTKIKEINTNKKINTKDKQKLTKPLKGDITKIDKKINAIPGKIKNLENKNAILRRENNVYENNINQLDNDIFDAENDINNYKTAIIKLKVI